MKSMKFSAALVVASSFLLTAGSAKAADLTPYLQKVQVQPKVQQLQVTEQSASAGDLSPSVQAAINDMSGGRVMPATKVARYKINFDVGIGSIIDSLIGIPVMVNIGRGTDIIYVQQFANAQEAAAAKKLCPQGVSILKSLIGCEKRSLPTSAAAAKQLHANEMVSFMFNKSLIGGADLARSVSVADIGLSSGILVRGEFEAQVSKLEGDKVRVRVLLSNGRGDRDKAKIEAPYEVFSIAMAGGVSIIPYAKIDREKLTGTMTVTDMVFDLANAEAAAAYDTLMSEAVSIKNLVNPWPVMATDLGQMYKLARADEGRPEGQRRVSLVSTMNARFSHYQVQKDIGIKGKILIGLKLIHKQKDINENSITTTLVDANGNKTSAEYDSSSFKNTNLQILYGLIGSKEERTGSTSVLSMLNDNGQPTGEINFVVTQNLKDNNLKPDEQKEMLLLLQNRMSPVFANRLNLAGRLDGGNIKDADIYTRVVFSNKALASLSARSATSIEQAVQTYVSNDPRWLRYFGDDVKQMAAALQTGTNSRAALSDRTEALTSLRSNKAFQQMGTGLMMWLMNVADLDSTVSVKLYMRGQGRSDTALQVGAVANEVALTAAQFVDDQLNATGDMVSSLALNATIIP